MNNNNNNNNNVSNNNRNNINMFRSLTNNLQWDQENNSNDGFRSLSNLRSQDDDDELSGGFRSGGVLLDQNYHGSNFLSNPMVDSFPMMHDSLFRKGLNTDMITTNQIDNNPKQFNVLNNTINKSVFINPNMNGPKIIVPVPIYSNIIDQDSIDTCCHLSKVVVQVIQQTIVNLLEAILETNELKIDFQVNRKNQFEFSGRVFTSSLSDYLIKIYKLKQKDKNGNISVVEIRKVYGDEFGYYKFEDLLLKKLQNKNILPKQQNNKSLFGLPLSMDLGSLTLEDEDEEMNEISEFSDNDIVSSIQENDEEFDFNLCETMLETLYSKDSYREEYMHDAYQLSTILGKKDKRSKNMINYILKNESKKLIEGILEPIKSNKLFCAFIIVHVLQSICILLAQKDIKSKLSIPKSFQNDILSIKKQWSNQNGIQNKIGPISVQFTRSQQIERECESILQLID